MQNYMRKLKPSLAAHQLFTSKFSTFPTKKRKKILGPVRCNLKELFWNKISCCTLNWVTEVFFSKQKLLYQRIGIHGEKKAVLS